MFPLIQLPKKLLGCLMPYEIRGKISEFPLIQLPKKLLGLARRVSFVGQEVSINSTSEEVIGSFPSSGKNPGMFNYVSINSTSEEVIGLRIIICAIAATGFPLIQLPKKLLGMV